MSAPLTLQLLFLSPSVAYFWQIAFLWKIWMFLTLPLGPKRSRKRTLGAEVCTATSPFINHPPCILPCPSSQGAAVTPGMGRLLLVWPSWGCCSNCFASYMRAVGKRRERKAVLGKQAFSRSATSLVHGTVLPLKHSLTLNRLFPCRISLFWLKEWILSYLYYFISWLRSASVKVVPACCAV